MTPTPRSHSPDPDVMSGYFHPNSLSASDLNDLAPLYPDDAALLTEEERPLLSEIDGNGTAGSVDAHDSRSPARTPLRIFETAAEELWRRENRNRRADEYDWLEEIHLRGDGARMLISSSQYPNIL